MENTEIKLTDNSKAVLGFLQANEGEYFCADIAAAIGSDAKRVNPVLTGLKKKGLVDVSEGQREVENKKGEKETRTYKMYSASEAGRAFIID